MMPLTQPNPIVKPFCNSGNAVSPPIGANTFIANQETGFPISQSTPLPAGTPVNREQMNGILQLYSNLILWMNAGGQWTFNDNVSAANGGYPLGIILYNASDNTFQRSLVANNTANFITNPSYLNDGVNWSSDITAGSITTTANDILLETNIDPITALLAEFTTSTVTPKPNIKLVMDDSIASAALEFSYRLTPMSYTRLSARQGYRLHMKATSLSIDSDLVVQSDFNQSYASSGNALWNWVKLPQDPTQSHCTILIWGYIPNDTAAGVTCTFPVGINMFSQYTPALTTTSSTTFPIFRTVPTSTGFTVFSNALSTNTGFTIIGLST